MAKPRFTINGVVVATGPTGDEVTGCIKKSTNFGLMLRCVGDDGQVRNTHIPFKTYRLDEQPGKGLEGVVEQLQKQGKLESPEKIVTWLSPAGLAFNRIMQDAIRRQCYEVLLIALGRQTREQQEKALQNGQPHILRRAAIELLDNAGHRGAIARDKSESDFFRAEALSQLGDETIALEIALDHEESRQMVLHAIECISSDEGIAKLYTEATFAVGLKQGFGRIDQSYSDRLSRIILNGSHLENRLAAAKELVTTRLPSIVSKTAYTLLEETPVWDHAISTLIIPFVKGIEGQDDEPRLVLAEKMLTVEGFVVNAFNQAFMSMVRSLRRVDGIVDLIALIRAKGKADGLGLPPKARITPTCALQVLCEQAWFGDEQWQALLNRYRKPEDNKIYELILAKMPKSSQK